MLYCMDCGFDLSPSTLYRHWSPSEVAEIVHNKGSEFYNPRGGCESCIHFGMPDRCEDFRENLMISLIDGYDPVYFRHEISKCSDFSTSVASHDDDGFEDVVFINTQLEEW